MPRERPGRADLRAPARTARSPLTTPTTSSTSTRMCADIGCDDPRPRWCGPPTSRLNPTEVTEPLPRSVELTGANRPDRPPAEGTAMSARNPNSAPIPSANRRRAELAGSGRYRRSAATAGLILAAACLTSTATAAGASPAVGPGPTTSPVTLTTGYTLSGFDVRDEQDRDGVRRLDRQHFEDQRSDESRPPLRGQAGHDLVLGWGAGGRGPRHRLCRRVARAGRAVGHRRSRLVLQRRDGRRPHRARLHQFDRQASAGGQ